MSLRSAALLTALLALSFSSFAAEPGLPRHPAPSPDGSQVAFSWQGDLWLVPSTGGLARRITANPGVERAPHWSRDGSKLAFASDRHGSWDVFVMASDGSEAPQRLTHASWADVPMDFSADGESLYFSSRRDESVRRMPALYRVSLGGGTPTLASPALARSVALAPDGERFAMVRGGTYSWRQDYRGSANREIWLRDARGTMRALTDFDGDDDMPMWAGDDSLVFVSTRSGRKNLHRLDLASGALSQLTSYAETGITYAKIAAAAPLVAFEQGGRIRLLDLDEGTTRTLSIEVPADPVDALLERITKRSDASELAANPKGDYAAFVVDADVFIVGMADKDTQKIAKPRTAQVTATPGREGDLAWSPDGKTLLFTSDRDGSNDIWSATLADEKTPWNEAFEFTLRRLTDTPANERGARFSPDGKTIAYTRGQGDLVLMDVESGDEKHTLLAHWSEADWVWSPDGRWIAFSRIDEAWNSEIYIVSTEGGEPYNVSRHPDDDTSPSWSPDGRRLVWTSKRHADSLDVWAVWLSAADHQRTPEDWLRFWREEKERKKSKKKGKDDEEPDDDADEKGKKDDEDGEEREEGDEKPELPEVEIDFDRLWERARPLTALNGEEGSPFVSKDGKTVFFLASPDGERDLYSVRWDGVEQERLTKGGRNPRAPRLSPDGKTIYHLGEGGTLARMSTKGEAGDALPFKARYELDLPARRAAVFDEAVRTIGEWFYDPDYHGLDLEHYAQIYRPWALAASTDADFSDVMNGLLGEFNASHMGYRTFGGGGDQSGSIGALFDPAAGGPGILVREVLLDAPAAREDVGLEAGDRLLAVDSREIGASTNVYELFTETAGQPLRIRFRKPDGSETKALVRPEPLGRSSQRRYETWVRQRAALVEKLSGGRLGYFHVQSMSMGPFEEFEQALFSAGAGKEGLIIDVRSNGGGWTTDYLMAVLDVKRHAYTVPRGASKEVKAYPQRRLPLASWTKPALAMCDEESYSNAEIFSWAFQTLGIGKVVGNTTFGAVISTGGTRLLDGALLRLPFRGWYVAGQGVNMEKQGAVPDVLVERPPAEDTSADQDTQLARAVEVFLEGLEDDPRYGAW